MLRHLWHRTESVLFSTPLGNISRNLYYYIHMYVPAIPLLRRTRIRGLLLAAICSKKGNPSNANVEFRREISIYLIRFRITTSLRLTCNL